MSKPSVTSTNHILPYGELSPAQFERLCLWLVEREGYTRFEHLGEAGSEQGRDVIAYDTQDRLWYFQCKRYQTLSADTLKAEVEKYNEHIKAGTIAKPHGVIFVTNAVVSAKARRQVETLCQKSGFVCEWWARTELDLKVKKHEAIVKEFFNLAHPLGHDSKVTIEIARLPRLLTPALFGRESELQILDGAWANQKINLVCLVGWGGVEKSALVSHWLQALGQDNWRGAEQVFAWSFYSQGTSDKTATSEYFINAALRWFGGDELANQVQSLGPWEKGEKLAHLIRQNRTLLILDGLEPVQYPPLSETNPEGGLKEQAMQALLRELAAHQSGLCLISTRYGVAELIQFEGRSVIRQSLDQLSAQAGAQLLKKLKVVGTSGELKAAASEYEGHALALTLLGSYLGDVYGGDVRRRHEIEALEDDRRHGSHARKILRAYEKWLGTQERKTMLDLLRVLGLFDRPADAASLAALRAEPVIAGLTDSLQGLSERGWQQTLAALCDLHLISLSDTGAQTMSQESLKDAASVDLDGQTLKYSDSQNICPLIRSTPRAQIDAHPLIREHFRYQIETQKPEAWRLGNARLFEHFSRRAQEYPTSLEEMIPLYSAITHAVYAEKYAEALDLFRNRISRGTEFFSMQKLGASKADISALTALARNSVLVGNQHLLTQQDQSYLLTQLSFRHAANGDISTSTSLIQKAFDLSIEQKDLLTTANILSWQYLVLGEITLSKMYARKSVEIADGINDINQQILTRTMLAQVQHYSGNLAEATAIFNVVEQLRSKERERISPQFLFLYQRHCELLLDLGDVAAALDKAELTRKWLERNTSPPLVTQAQNYYCLARCYLQEALTPTVIDQRLLSLAREASKLAEVTMRKAGRYDHLPRVLLAKAQLSRSEASFAIARQTLEEVHILVTHERSQMKLYEVDYHLESARLALALHDAAKAREHYDAARKLIDETGYHRRDGELQEIEKQL